MHIIYDYDLWWLNFELTKCDIFINDDVIKELIWLVTIGSKQNCKCHLIDELSMRHSLNLSQFLLILMEIMCLVQEIMENG